MKKLLTLLILITSISAYAQKGSYVLRLSSVEQEGASVGQIKIDSVKTSQLLNYVSNYSDNIIDATFNRGLSCINFEILNKGKKTIKINWNEAAYIDYNNNTGKVMHVGVKYIDRNSDQPSTSIIGGAKISDLATPSGNIYFSSGSYGGWRETPLLPSLGKKDEHPLVGKQVKLLLPITDDAGQKNYVFIFDILFKEYQK